MLDSGGQTHGFAPTCFNNKKLCFQLLKKFRAFRVFRGSTDFCLDESPVMLFLHFLIFS
ncbi:hypothetical protein V144x_53230 [Gimesia aquarii]|uniref:Uncharacterized protein n=1 Tax=Gimesia aquarii TaxID=2527964 RepID=A0A517W3K0_9PLAN|nr:hypothetical protein V144x_53230 [Gimesia aquarii]